MRVVQELGHPEVHRRPVLRHAVCEAAGPEQVVGGAVVRVAQLLGARRVARLVHVPPVLVAETEHLRGSSECQAGVASKC